MTIDITRRRGAGGERGRGRASLRSTACQFQEQGRELSETREENWQLKEDCHRNALTGHEPMQQLFLCFQPCKVDLLLSAFRGFNVMQFWSKLGHCFAMPSLSSLDKSPYSGKRTFASPAHSAQDRGREIEKVGSSDSPTVAMCTRRSGACNLRAGSSRQGRCHAHHCFFRVVTCEDITGLLFRAISAWGTKSGQHTKTRQLVEDR